MAQVILFLCVLKKSTAKFIAKLVSENKKGVKNPM
jgi:hypothetical protein